MPVKILQDNALKNLWSGGISFFKFWGAGSCNTIFSPEEIHPCGKENSLLMAPRPDTRNHAVNLESRSHGRRSPAAVFTSQLGEMLRVAEPLPRCPSLTPKGQSITRSLCVYHLNVSQNYPFLSALTVSSLFSATIIFPCTTATATPPPWSPQLLLLA